MARRKSGGSGGVTTRSREAGPEEKFVIARTALQRIVSVIESAYASWAQIEEIERMARETLEELEAMR